MPLARDDTAHKGPCKNDYLVVVLDVAGSAHRRPTGSGYWQLPGVSAVSVRHRRAIGNGLSNL